MKILIKSTLLLLRIDYLLITLVFALTALSMSGCSADLKNISSEYQVSDQFGVVAFSLTSSGECGYAYFVDVRSVDKKIKRTIGMQDALEERDWQRRSGECTLENMTGKLLVIELPPGNYIMYKFSGMHRIRAFESEEEFFISF